MNTIMGEISIAMMDIFTVTIKPDSTVPEYVIPDSRLGATRN